MLLQNTPTENEGFARPRGWMNSKIFLQWLHISKFTHPFNENSVPILLDDHKSHETLDVVNFCRNYNIHLISSPPRAIHKLQPLNRTFMKPLKTRYERYDLWMGTNAEAPITDYDIAGFVREAFTKVNRLEIAVSGFKCTGIYPLDRNRH